MGLPKFHLMYTHVLLNILFYMDDFKIPYRSPIWNAVERKLQDSINIVEKIAQTNGFKFVTSKTSMLHFTKLSILPSKELRFGNIRIQSLKL